MPRISQIHNIRYEESGMRYWKAYDIGKGEYMAHDETLSVDVPKLKVIKPFPEECPSSGAMAKSSKCNEGKTEPATCDENAERNALFECPSDGVFSLLIQKQSSKSIWTSAITFVACTGSLNLTT
ncbi:hypothetical protein OS493_036667 [Desmophyllum pertusum]|uniref:Uncharacterized protein n=1 Tax=Desmophyllum pertusum TaxID=174260 RepID=A0A9W9Y799_9CNID|nr:hypothetical protein OS493_036667 [Desmophyllum pertusum]